MAAERHRGGGKGSVGADDRPIRDVRERSPLRNPPFPPDPFVDPFFMGRKPPPRDPFFDDPYRRLPPDPYFDRFRSDPFRRDPFGPPDPFRDFRDPFPSLYDTLPPKKPVNVDCEIISMSIQQREYADLIERRLKNLNLLTDQILMRDDRTVQQQVEDATRRGCLFAIVINSQNEMHRSLTLNILHGLPQEHRNMPMDDALSLVAKSFDKYLQTEKEKITSSAGVNPLPTASPPANTRHLTDQFLPPPKDISYLLNLLADNRPLTVEELDKVIGYLRERRDKLLDAEGRPLLTNNDHLLDKQPTMQPTMQPAMQPAMQQQQQQLDELQQQLQQQKQHQELQNKILSMMNGSTSATAGTTTTLSRNPLNKFSESIFSPSTVTSATQPISQPQVLPGTMLSSHLLTGTVAPPKPTLGTSIVSNPSSAPALINFDNPTVQKALDNLIQSGPNLLKNIAVSSLSPVSNQPAAAGPGSLFSSASVIQRRF